MNTTLSDTNQNTPEDNGSSLKYHFMAIFLLSGIMYYLLDSATDEEILDITRLFDLQSQDYDYFMTDIDSIHYSSDGMADYRFRAHRLTHFPNPEYSIIETPQLMLYSEDNSIWVVNSGTGRIEIDSERNQQRLELNEDVIISGVTADGKPVNIYTDTLIIYPEKKSMGSDSDVLFETEGFTTSSKGFTADLNSNIFRQLDNGQLQYDNL